MLVEAGWGGAETRTCLQSVGIGEQQECDGNPYAESRQQSTRSLEANMAHFRGMTVSDVSSETGPGLDKQGHEFVDQGEGLLGKAESGRPGPNDEDQPYTECERALQCDISYMRGT